MIDRGSNRWIHRQDLESDPSGREDTAEHKAVCLEYLVDPTASSPPSEGAALAQRVQAQLVAARVRDATSTRADLERRLEQANATIDRLLAFVPARAPQIPEPRLDELVSGLLRSVTANFPSASLVAVVVAQELDRDTEACHKITLKIELPDSVEASAIAAGIQAAHRYFAQAASVNERLAVRLIVAPTIVTA